MRSLKSGLGLIAGMVCGGMLLLNGGGAVGGWWTPKVIGYPLIHHIGGRGQN